MLALTLGRAAPASAEAGVRAAEHPGFGRLVFEFSGPAHADADTSDEHVVVHFTDAVDGDVAAAARRLATYVTAVDVAADRLSVVLHLRHPATLKLSNSGKLAILDLFPRQDTVPEVPKTPKSGPAVKPVKPARIGAVARATAPLRPEPPESPPPPKAEAPADQAAVSVASAAPVPEPTAPPQAASQPPAQSPSAVTAVGAASLEILPDGARLHVRFADPVAAAVMQRGDALWLGFASHQKLDISAIAASTDGPVRKVDQRSLPDGTVLKLTLKPGLAPAVSRNDGEWLVDLKDAPSVAPPAPVEVRAEPSAARGPRVFMPVLDAAEPITLSEADGAIRYQLVPLLAPAQGINLPRDYPQFQVLRSAQGIALRPKTEEVVVASLPNGVEVTAKGGLLLGQALTADRKQPDSHPILFHFADWRGPPGKFTETKQALQNVIATAPPSGQTAARSALARFYFANGFNADALGVLVRLAQQDPRAADERGFRALKGAVEIGLHRYNAAAADLSIPELAHDPEAGLWRGVLSVAQQDWTKARDEFAKGSNVIADYPPDMRVKLHLAMARAFYGAGDPASAKTVLGALEQEIGNDRASLPVAAEAIYLRGEAEQALGEKSDAMRDIAAAVKADYRPVHSRALFEQTNLELAQGSIKPSEAVERLEGLRFSWRGDAFEPELLRRLGDLHVAAGDYRGGLAMWHQLVTYFAKTPEAAQAKTDMNAVFLRLYLNGESEKLPPVEAVGLFFDYRELTPTDTRGDEMIRKLADRMVRVDLLDRAAELLEHQVTRRLNGEEKSRIGARLAVIRLLDRKPDLALRALDESNVNPVSDPLAAERRHLQARAFVDLTRFDDAAKLLAGDRSRDAELTRVDIAWRRKDWTAAAQSLTALLADRDKDPAPLTATERQTVLQLAVALSLARDTAGIDRVRDRYGARLVDTPDADAFKVLTAKTDPQNVEFRQLADTIAGVNQLEAFMAEYRAKLQKTKLSALN